MTIKKSIILMIALALSLSACNFFTQPTDIQTENLQSELARTQIASIRASATVSAAELAITSSFAQESIQNVELQSTRIAATLVAQGTVFIDLPPLQVQSDFPTQEPSINVQPNVTETVFPEIANPLITQGASARGDATIVPPTQIPLAQSTSDGNPATLTNLQVSARVGADDCALSPSTSFSQGISELYVSAVAQNVTAGTLISSRWVHDGTEAAYYDWRPTFDINGACIWFHLPGDEVSLTAGDWTVQLAIDGTPVGNSVAFTILAG